MSQSELDEALLTAIVDATIHESSSLISNESSVHTRSAALKPCLLRWKIAALMLSYAPQFMDKLVAKLRSSNHRMVKEEWDAFSGWGDSL